MAEKEKIKGFSDPRLVGREVYVLDKRFTITEINKFVICDRESKHDDYDDCVEVFCIDGRYSPIDLIPRLSFTPYTVTIGDNGQVIIKGYSDEIELEDENEPKVGDIGWFWENESTGFLYGKLNGLSDCYYWNSIGFKHFSKTCPEWIKEIVNK